MLASVDQFTANVLRSPEAKDLKLISRWGVGYDSIDIPVATEQGIVVAFVPNLLNNAVADYTMSMLCAYPAPLIACCSVIAVPDGASFFAE